jgi:hypothetical protein
MGSDIRYYYPFKWLKQSALVAGMPDLDVKEYVGVGHLSSRDSLFCGQDELTIEKDLGASGGVTVATRIHGISICHDCQEKWKHMPGSPRSRWERQDYKKV